MLVQTVDQTQPVDCVRPPQKERKNYARKCVTELIKFGALPVRISVDSVRKQD